MAKNTTTAVTAALLLGLSGGLAAAPAHAALDEAALAAVEAPEVAQVAVGVAAVLDRMNADADQQAIVAALHDYLSVSIFSETVVMEGLEIVLAGDWSDSQAAALRSLFSRYVAGDVEPPRGGAEALMIDGGAELRPTGSNRLDALTPSADAPMGGVLAAGPAQDDAITPPPAPSGAGGSDYAL